jgi:hypothetical protein
MRSLRLAAALLPLFGPLASAMDLIAAGFSGTADTVNSYALVADMLYRSKLQTEQPNFKQIFEYTLFNETLPDGKHPVWLYFRTNNNIIRVDVPFMHWCTVTLQSNADLGVIRSKNYDVIFKGSRPWNFSLEIWKAAFQRSLMLGPPKSC